MSGLWIWYDKDFLICLNLETWFNSFPPTRIELRRENEWTKPKRNERMIPWYPNIDEDDVVNVCITNLFILALPDTHTHERQCLSAGLVTPRCFISHCCAGRQAHAQRGSILARFFLFSLYSLGFSFSFMLSPHEYATQRETHTHTHKQLLFPRWKTEPSIFLKDSRFLTCYFLFTGN